MGRNGLWRVSVILAVRDRLSLEDRTRTNASMPSASHGILSSGLCKICHRLFKAALVELMHISVLTLTGSLEQDR